MRGQRELTPERRRRRRHQVGRLVASVGALVAVQIAGATAHAPSAGAAPVPPCGDPRVRIHDVQGNGAATPIAGATVSVEGIVTVLVPGTGFFIQEDAIDFDADPQTSEGILVVTPAAAPVSVGDQARVTGVVAEFRPAGAAASRTQLTPVTVTVCSSGRSVTPVDVELGFRAPDDWERYEGMLVTIDQPLVVTDSSGLGPADEIGLALGRRLVNPTSTVEPGPAAVDVQDLNDRSRVPARYDWRAGGLSATDTLRVGDVLTAPLIGVLDQRPDGYRVEPVEPAALSFDRTNARPGSPAGVGGIARVASMDLGGYFTTLDSGGANSPQELTRQRDKLVAALAGLDADIVGVTGLQNDSGAALASLVEGLNATSPGTWAAVDTGTIGTHATKVGIVYRTAALTAVGDHAVLDSSVDARFDDATNRPSLAQAFGLAGGARLTVVVDDLAARDADCGDDEDAGDGQARCNATRTAAAEALVDWIATDPVASGDPDTIVLGNFSAHTNEDPIEVMRSAGFADLAADSYSSVLGGQSGAIDHAFASRSLASQVTGSTVWHINADEPALLDYNTESKSADDLNTLYAATPFRSSGRDPLLVGINLSGELPVAEDDDATTPEDGSVVIEVAANDHDANGDLDPSSVAVVRSPATGTATVGTDGRVTYTPAPDFHGTDSFDYQICDATDGCDRATVTVTVSAVNDPPVARRDVATVSSGGRVSIDVLDNDTDVDGAGDLDGSTLTVISDPRRGTATVDPSNRTISYSVPAGAAGSDEFRYRVCDRGALCATAVVDVHIDASPPPASPPNQTAPPPNQTAPPPDQTLAATGSNTNVILASAVLALSAGSVLLALSRRRRYDQT